MWRDTSIHGEEICNVCRKEGEAELDEPSDPRIVQKTKREEKE